MTTSIPAAKKAAIFAELSQANIAFQKLYPGDSPNRQPVHTVYGGAHLFKSTTALSLAKVALKTVETYAPNFVVLAKALALPGAECLPSKKKKIKQLAKRLASLKTAEAKQDPAYIAYKVYEKMLEKLKREAVEDFRIDFEDGFGNRTDEEEDATAQKAALETAKGMKDNTLPPFIGIRIKPFTEELKERGLQTLDLYLTTLLVATGGQLPNNFIVMLPKVTIPEQITALVRFFEIIEAQHHLKKGSLKLEIMVETTQAVMDAEGKNPLKKFIQAGEGRCIATHFGTYDYTASCNITAKYQAMDHPVCDFAHHVTKVALAHTGTFLSDGATNILPVGPHRGTELTKAQQQVNKQVVHDAWKMGYDHIRHSLWNGFYQGWDLHPAQLPMRYAAVFAFFLESYDDALERLSAFVQKAAQASLTGDVFDDAATGQGLLNYFLRALNSGAISEAEVLATGLTLEEINSRSFAEILKKRRKEA